MIFWIKGFLHPNLRRDRIRRFIDIPEIKGDVGVVVDLLLETISKALSDNEHIELRGFGSFKVKTRKARVARNPRTGERVNVPEKIVPYFKASRELVKLVDSA